MNDTPRGDEMNANTKVIGTVLGGGMVGSRPRLPVTLTYNAGGTITVTAPHCQKDGKSEKALVKWVKRIHEDASNGAEWTV